MSGIYHQNKEWANVTTPNPAGTASTDLTKLGIDGTNYRVTDSDAIHTSDVGIANGVAELDSNGKVPKAELPSDVVYDNPTFTEASTRANIASGETIATLLGKIKKFFSDLKDLAFIGKDGTSSTKYLRGDGTWQSALELQGRVYGSGDDEGLVIKADTTNHWAGISLVNNTGRHTYFAMKDGQSDVPLWRFHDGTNMHDIIHPAKSGTIAVTTDIPAAVAVKGNNESIYRTGNVNLTAENIGATQGYLCTIPNQSSPSAGWRRLCKMSYVANHGYSSGIIHIGGGYSNGAPTGAVVAFSIMHFTPSFTVLNCAYKGLVKWLRFVRGTGDDDLWLDAYMSSQSGAVSTQVFFISGNVDVTDIQNSTTIITDEVTPLAQIEINTVSGKVITSDDIGSQSVNYAATAGSATDSTKVPLAGGKMTGTLGFEENSVAINFRPSNAQYYATASYQTTGQEALVFATKFLNTSFMFVNGEDSVTHHETNRWQSIIPALQIKNNKIAIAKQIAQNTDLTYPLEVNGDVQATNFRGNLVGTADKATKDGDGNTISSTYAKKPLYATGSVSSGKTGVQKIAQITLSEVGTYYITGWAKFTGGGKKAVQLWCAGTLGESWEDSTIATGEPKTFSTFAIYTSTVANEDVKVNSYTVSASNAVTGGIVAFKIA